MNQEAKKDIYSIITDKIIEQLENGVIIKKLLTLDLFAYRTYKGHSLNNAIRKANDIETEIIGNINIYFISD